MSDKKYFIGVDSDGTAFDSMTIKHTDSFIPAMISVWNLDSVRERVTEIEQYINLYSKDRGVNRVPGLLKTFEIMIDEGIFDKDVSDLDAKRAGILQSVHVTFLCRPIRNGALHNKIYALP